MSKIVSKLVTGPTNDVLAGTVLNTLPTDAPYYDVEVQVSSQNDAAANSMTLLAGGVSVLERAYIPGGFKVSPTTGNASFRGEPRSDGPVAFFSAPAGTQLTLNITGVAATNICNVYVVATPSATPSYGLGVGHIARIDGAATITELDVLKGTPVGTIPNYGSLWNVIVQPAVVAIDSSGDFTTTQDANLSFLVDTDTVCENFILPFAKPGTWGIEERDVLISAAVTPGSRLTLNVYKPTTLVGGLIVYRVFANPVA